MSSTMKKGICWALAALQVAPENVNQHEDVLNAADAGDASKSHVLALHNNNNNNYTNNNRNSHHHQPLHQKNSSSNNSTTGTKLIADVVHSVVDSVFALATGSTCGEDAAIDDSENVRPEYTRDEVSDHCSSESCWIVVNNRVYDVTRFLRVHPGGEDIILEYGGHDATSAFIDKGHSGAAFDMLGEYCIGEVTKADWYPEKNHT